MRYVIDRRYQEGLSTRITANVALTFFGACEPMKWCSIVPPRYPLKAVPGRLVGEWKVVDADGIDVKSNMTKAMAEGFAEGANEIRNTIQRDLERKLWPDQLRPCREEGK